jgi:hypothetical protein
VYLESIIKEGKIIMTTLSTQTLGQLTIATDITSLPTQLSDTISTTLINNKAPNARKIQVWVASDSDIKVQAAKNAVLIWAASYIPICKIETKGFLCRSEISEQPHSKEETKKGAQNRLTKLKEIVENEPTTPDALQFFVSMENGVMQENLKEVKNPEVFVNGNGNCWVDRCFVIVEIAYQNFQASASSFSEGVTTPLAAVRKSEESNWTTTCGSFIEKEYTFPANDWHKQMAGKGRQVIIQETLAVALGVKR